MAKYYQSIGCVFRQENKWLLEWIEYHRMIGIDHIYMLCNDDADNLQSVADLLHAYTAKGYVTLILWEDRTGYFQLNGNKFILKTYWSQTEWMIFLDIDEFIVSQSEASLNYLLHQYDKQEIAVLSVGVETFGDSGLEKDPEFVLESNIWHGKRNCAANQTGKNFIRTITFKDYFTEDSSWQYDLQGSIVDTDRKIIHKKKCRRPNDILLVHHYGVKSKEHWNHKVEKSQPTGRYGGEELTEEVWAHKYKLLNQNVLKKEFDPNFLHDLKERVLQRQQQI